MTFEKWWENVFNAPAHGIMEEHMKEAFEAGRKEGYKEGSDAAWKILKGDT